ncbi:carotenoid oxygenase, partial [Aspergillus heterothallicus]
MGSIPASTPTKTPYKNWPNDAAFDSPTTSPTPTRLHIIGSFPRCVSGTLYRTGPAQYKVSTTNGTYARHHWFDGFTQIHRFEIAHAAAADDTHTNNTTTTVTYTSRSQCDALLEEARRGKNLDSYVTFGQKRDPCMSYFEKVKCMFKPADPGPENPGMQSVGVTVRPGMPGYEKDRLIVLTDNEIAQQLDRETLEAVGVTKQSGLHPELK